MINKDRVINDDRKVIEAIDRTLQGEFAALEAYDKEAQAFRTDSDLGNILKFRRAHSDVISYLKAMLLNLNKDPVKDQGLMENLAVAYVQATRLMGSEAVLSTLVVGEEFGLEQLEQAVLLDIDKVDRAYIRENLIPQQKRRIDTLKAMINKQ